MIGAAERYEELLFELLLQREIGPLSQAKEADYAAELDRHWWAMTTDEQAEVERLFAERSAPEAPERLDHEDQTVLKGDHTPPRRAA